MIKLSRVAEWQGARVITLQGTVSALRVAVRTLRVAALTSSTYTVGVNGYTQWLHCDGSVRGVRVAVVTLPVVVCECQWLYCGWQCARCAGGSGYTAGGSVRCVRMIVCGWQWERCVGGSGRGGSVRCVHMTVCGWQ